PELLTGVAALISLFIVLWTYGQRHEIKTKMEMKYDTASSHIFLCFWVYCPISLSIDIQLYED
ncbi:MAG TPA: hypothetical protein VN316_00065, partial [candidate division Zixibacteria bacterium]|nr:hypothetical protein [candidate division Zixibacteria bacterium]